jgi:hypothetical protein
LKGRLLSEITIREQYEELFPLFYCRKHWVIKRRQITKRWLPAILSLYGV